MRPVMSVSLNGRAYQLEDDAHAALAIYLESAERALAGNPDRGEIVADLEQAIADKCGRFLNPHKTVIVRGEIEQVIREMGPVDCGAAGDAPQDSAPAGTEAAPRRLYQISDGAMLSGVCKGIAVYLNVDVTLVRLLFVVAAVLTGGLAVLVYSVMMFIVPYANTPEEHAAARGLPFNARVLVEQAKLKAAQLAEAAAHAGRSKGSRGARAQWKAERRRARAQWRREWRRSRARCHAEWHAHRWAGAWADAAPPSAPPPWPPLARFLCALIGVAAALLTALLTLAWLLALFSLITTGAVLGWVPHQLPLWAAILVLIVVYQMLLWPLRAVRYAVRPRVYGYPHPWHGFSDALIALSLISVVLWLFVHHGQDVRHTVDSLQRHAGPAWHQLLLAWQTLIHGAH